MKSHRQRQDPFKLRVIPAMIAACGLAATLPGPGLAELADLADVPLANSPSDAVLPNLMYILDDSGSMLRGFMPEEVDDSNMCKSVNCTAGGCSVGSTSCHDGGSTSDWGDPPYFSAQFNQVYYNPDIYFEPGVNSTGGSLGNSDPAAAKIDYYLDATTINLKTDSKDVFYCATSSASAAQLASTAVCRRNGIDNVGGGYFLYFPNDMSGGGYPAGSSTALAFRHRVIANNHPYYYTISANEWCKDANLIECQLTQDATFNIPAPVRWCSGRANAASTAAVSDTASSTTPKCQKKFTDTYDEPRYGRFTRTDITSSTATFAQSATAVRPDCTTTANVCTYAEEIQNFANWYTYYRTRMQMMKTATGRAFRPIGDNYRVGFITINPGDPVKDPVSSPTDTRYLPLQTFDATQKLDFYTTLYAQDNHGATPLRQALSRIGRHYAGKTDDINDGMADPVTHSCQQNFALLTSDGYYNDVSNGGIATPAKTPGGSAVGNVDGTPNTSQPLYVTRAGGQLDGSGTTVNTGDVTLETGQALCTGNNNVSFPNGSSGTTDSTNCGCSGNERRVWQRDRTLSYNTAVVDGITQAGASTAVVSATFSVILDCQSHLETKVQRITEQIDLRCSSNSQTTFSATLTSGPPHGQQTNCGCTDSSKKKRLIRRTRPLDVQVDYYDGGAGVVTSVTTVTGIATTFSALTNCTSGSVSSGPTVVLTTASSTTLSSNSQLTLTSASFTLAPNPQSTATGQSVTTTTFGGASNSLADIAMYYYKNDLRCSSAGGTNCADTAMWAASIADNNVPTTSKDIANHQHMVTFTLGMGLVGRMDYRSDYESATSGDFAKIRNADTTCSWSSAAGQTCNWPLPVEGDPSTLDDMWHAAVNGRGIFYSAANPTTLADGLSGALSALKVQTAAASASATSSPNITETDNFIYSSTFRTVRWDGQISAQRIDTNTGNVLPAIVWEAQAQLDTKAELADGNVNERKVFMFDSSNSSTVNTSLKRFLWGNLSSTSSVCSATGEQACFANKGTAFSQYASLNGGQKIQADNGENLVDFLRGKSALENPVFRDREHVLGDAVNATPAYVRAPVFEFLDAVSPTYSAFRTANAGRQGVLYIAANDGMLHAFNGDTGAEMFAYVPRMPLPNLHNIATANWETRHIYSVDGSPQVMDAFQVTDSSASPMTGVWKTVLVGGLNKGGRGFYALDVTDPADPKGLWEFCSDSTLCAHSDIDLGLTYGNAVVTKLPSISGSANSGKWVAIMTSGLNNVTPGDGEGHLWVRDLFTGALVYKADTGAGSTTTPSGLSKISAFADDFNKNNTALAIYGGDLLGNVWKFDLTTDPATVTKLVELKDGGGKPQGITSRPELGVIDSQRVLFIGTGRYLGEDDLVDPATVPDPDNLGFFLPWAYQQSFYAFKDKAYGATSLRGTTPGLVQQVIDDDGTTVRTTTNNTVNWTAKDGWFVDFNPENSSPGERVNLDPQLVLGTLVVVSNVPNNNACTVGGDSFIYQFNYATGSYIASAPGQQVATKFIGQITVGLVVIRLPSGVFKGVATGATGTKTPVGVNVGGAGSSGRRVSWRELIK